MGKCKLCGNKTVVVFNIEFKKVHVCEECAVVIFIQQAAWYARGGTTASDMKVEVFIKTLRESEAYIEDIYLNGGCYQFHLVLKNMFSDAIPYINKEKDHVVTMLRDNLYDIRGVVSNEDKSKYVPMTRRDLKVAAKWSFSKHNMLKIKECPSCEEPIVV